MSYRDTNTTIRNELRALHKLNPETAKGFSVLSAAAMTDGALDKKTREYVALAIAITQRCEPCVTLHIEALIKIGCTR